MNGTLLIKGATVVTLDPQNSVFQGDVLIEHQRIARLGDEERTAGEVIDGRGRILLPGFVQTHVHLCQTLFRGYADDLALIDWLKKRVWPMEAAHTIESIHASAQLGIAEMIRSGTTCALTMETVNHTDGVFQAIADSGFRATGGKCMMDKGEGVPDALLEETRASIAESLVLLDRWHGRAGGRIRYAFAPRFAVSCTRELLEQVAGLSAQRGITVHSHASENLEEIELVEQETGERNIVYLNDLELTGPGVVLAHCVHLNDVELDILRRTRTHVAHCPSSNLKLASGFARVAEMIDFGISVSLGADGAACNNRLDMFTEMRTAALIQKALRGPETLPALTALRMATVAGARALGLGDEIGTIEVGKRADMILLNLERFHATPAPDLISTIVYSAGHDDVETVIIDGQVVMRDRQLTTLNETQVIARANEQAGALARALES